MKNLYFVTGASGTGKTTAVKNLQKTGRNNIVFCFFDSVGVPSPEVMKTEYGGPEEWQRKTTIEWVKSIKRKYLDKSSVILDGQINQQFIDEACKKIGITSYKTIVFICDNPVRDARLIERGHPELANQDMANWNQYLKKQAEVRGDITIDTSHLSINQSMAELEKNLDMGNP